MPNDEETSSDTLRDPADEQEVTPIEYLRDLSEQTGGAIGAHLDMIAEQLDEARAERDQLHDALKRMHSNAPSLTVCTCDEDEDCPMCQATEVLREVEAGDTAARIREEARREAFEEAAGVAEDVDAHLEWTETPGGHREHDADRTARNIADAIRALAEGDDQEDDEDGDV